MKYAIAFLVLTLLLRSVASQADDATAGASGLITVKSNVSVNETANQFEALIKAKGLSFFSRIDHAANASSVDLELAPTQLIIFGNPKAGTPLMQCAPTVAIDLPQKALIWQDAAGSVWLSYNDPSYLKKRHDMQGCEPVLDKISGLLKSLADLATK